MQQKQSESLSLGGLSLGGVSFEMQEFREAELSVVLVTMMGSVRKRTGEIGVFGPLAFERVTSFESCFSRPGLSPAWPGYRVTSRASDIFR